MNEQTPTPEFIDQEDEVEASKAPLLDHLNELRSRLIWSIVSLFAATLVCFVFAQPIYDWLIVPFTNMFESINPGEELEFVYTGAMELFFVRLKVSMFAGFFLAFPFIAYQLYRFVAPGLYRQERGAFLPYLVAAPLLFVAGGAFVYYVMLPLLARVAILMQQDNIQFLPRVSEYLSLVMRLMIGFGLSFQLPVVLTLLGKLGVVSSKDLAKGRKYAIVGILFVAMFLTPPDGISQVILSIPVYALYEVAIFCVKLIEQKEEDLNAAADA